MNPGVTVAKQLITFGSGVTEMSAERANSYHIVWVSSCEAIATL